MTFQHLTIASAKINGLTKDPTYLEPQCVWLWEFYFTRSSNPYASCFERSQLIKVGGSENTFEESKAFCDELKKKIVDKMGIREGERVPVIIGENGELIAIGKKHETLWLDVNDQFTLKGFEDFNIIPKSLEVD